MSKELTAAQIKEYCESKWNSPGVIQAANGNVFEPFGLTIKVKAGKKYDEYLTKEQRARRKGLAIYNPSLAPSILAQAEITGHVETEIPVLDSYGRPQRDKKTKKTVMQTVKLARYIFTPETKIDVPAIKPANKPAKRVTQRKIDAAAAILAKLERNQWAAFFARFGVKLDIAEKIAANDNLTEAAREFLKAALAA